MLPQLTAETSSSESTNAVTGGFGKAKAIRIVLKEIHAEYDGLDGKFFRVWE